MVGTSFTGLTVNVKFVLTTFVPSLSDNVIVAVPLSLSAGETVIVRLQAGVTEVGTLQLEAVARSSGERWKVEFDTRDNSP